MRTVPRVATLHAPLSRRKYRPFTGLTTQQTNPTQTEICELQVTMLVD